MLDQKYVAWYMSQSFATGTVYLSPKSLDGTAKHATPPITGSPGGSVLGIAERICYAKPRTRSRSRRFADRETVAYLLGGML